jgi:hypothetical protein
MFPVPHLSSLPLRSWLVAVGKMFPFGPGVSKLFPFRTNAKSWFSYGFQRCFQCFHIFRRVLKEKLNTTLDVLWADSWKYLETLETFPQALATEPLTRVPKWKQFGNTWTKWKHPTRLLTPTPPTPPLI